MNYFPTTGNQRDPQPKLKLRRWQKSRTIPSGGSPDAYGSEGEAVRLHRELVKDTIVWEVERGVRLTAADILRALGLRSQAWDRMRAFQQNYEYFIAPTTQVLPFDVNLPYPTEVAGVRMSTYIEWQKSCILISALENPAMSVPCGFTDDGLPVGLQIVSRHRDEFSVLQLAYAFEQATKVGRRRPGMAA